MISTQVVLNNLRLIYFKKLIGRMNAFIQAFVMYHVPLSLKFYLRINNILKAVILKLFSLV